MEDSFLSILKEKDQQRAERFDTFINKYSKYNNEDSDVIDLETMTIVENRGHVKSIKMKFGSINLAPSTIIQKYMTELEKKEEIDSLSKSSTLTRRKEKSKSLSQCQDDNLEQALSTLHLNRYQTDHKSSVEVFKNMLESFQSCAENVIQDFFVNGGFSPKSPRSHKMEASFGEGKYSMKNSLLYGDKMWDITLQVSSRDKSLSRYNFRARPPVEPIIKNVYKINKNESILLNLLNLMRIEPLHTSLTPVMPLRSSTSQEAISQVPTCDILALNDKNYAGCENEELLQPTDFEEINCSPLSLTSLYLNCSTSFVRNDDGHGKGELCSPHKSQPVNLKSLRISPVSSKSIYINASSPVKKRCFVVDDDDDEVSILKAKKVCNNKESNMTESDANSTDNKSDTGTEVKCFKKKMASREQTPVCDLALSLNGTRCTMTPKRVTTSMKQKCNIKNLQESADTCMLENTPYFR